MSERDRMSEQSLRPQPTEPTPPPAESGLPEPSVRPVPGELPAVENVPEITVPQLVTELKSLELQIGEHVMKALQHPTAVGVLTSVVVTPDARQVIVSVAVDPKRMTEIQELLYDEEQQRIEEVPCVGFHCFVDKKERP